VLYGSSTAIWVNFLKCPRSRCAHELIAAIVSFTCINVSQGSVAMQFRCGGIFNNHFIANFPQSVSVKEFLKSVNIWRRYGQKCGGMFFLTHGVYIIYKHFYFFYLHYFLNVFRCTGKFFQSMTCLESFGCLYKVPHCIRLKLITWRLCWHCHMLQSRYRHASSAVSNESKNTSLPVESNF